MSGFISQIGHEGKYVFECGIVACLQIWKVTFQFYFMIKCFRIKFYKWHQINIKAVHSVQFLLSMKVMHDCTQVTDI